MKKHLMGSIQVLKQAMYLGK